MAQTLNVRNFALATLVPVGMMIVAMALKPLWRDEYFSLFFSDPTQPLALLAEHRWAVDSHPPIHNVFLRAWGFVSQHPFWLKSLSLVFLLLGGLTLRWITPITKRRTLYIFLLMCLGSYWIIYFATEIRPYVLNFALSAILTLLAVRFLEDERVKSTYWLLWLAAGALLAMTHYFGALWLACLGLVAGLSVLAKGRRSRFITIGLLSAAALIPLGLWLHYAWPVMSAETLGSELGFGEKLTGGLHQFLRGLIVKTFGSNPLLTILGIGGIAAAILGKDKTHRALLLACGLMVVTAVILHLFFIDMIKERAFISIMPAILYIMADHISEKSSPVMKYVPLVTAVMPFLFIPEYFKDKEKIPELRNLLSENTACQTVDLLAFYRPARPEALYPFATKLAVQADQEKRTLIDMRRALSKPDNICPVKAIAVLLPKHNQVLIDEANEHLARLGYEAGELTSLSLGKGRTVVWVK